jgi:hypothetical protein
VAGQGLHRLTLLLLLLFAALVVSVAQGAPEDLPGVALGSDALLHVERAAAFFAIVVAVLSVLAQSARGRLPTQFSTSGLAYEANAADDTWAAVKDLQAQVDDLQDVVDRLVLLLGRQLAQD